MGSFIITTDSGANLRQEFIEKYKVTVLPLAYIINGESFSGSGVTEERTKEIYDAIRNKSVVSTAALNEEECKTVFEKILTAGQDLLYIGFSSALSCSYENAARVLDGLKLKYADRKILYIDGLSAAMGQGRYVIEACKLRDEGKTIDETLIWLTENRPKNTHLFTVETLSYLFRGGRVKKTAFLLGTILQIKPILHVDDKGHLTSIGKIIGRKASLNNLAERTAAMIENPENQTVYINHGDCIDDAKYVADKIASKVKVAGFDFSMLNVIIGAHSGPGTVAVFFAGKTR